MSPGPIPDLSVVASPPRMQLTTDDFEIQEVLGSGGQAKVSRATITIESPIDQIAVKEPIAPQTLAPEVVERIQQEAQTWKLVDKHERHRTRWAAYEHIVGIIDTGDRLPWIAMEYMDGGGLDNRLQMNADGLPLNEALWIAACICRGLEIAHNNGRAHLDLKPANVLFRETDEEKWDVPKLADWGIARILAEDTGTMDALSVEYAAPEQFNSGKFGEPDALTDVYQVGAILYAMLTGDPPYVGSPLAVMNEITRDVEQTPPSEVRSDVPSSVDGIVETAMARQKTERYRSIEVLANELDELVAETTDTATKTGSTGRNGSQSERFEDDWATDVSRPGKDTMPSTTQSQTAPESGQNESREQLDEGNRRGDPELVRQVTERNLRSPPTGSTDTAGTDPSDNKGKLDEGNRRGDPELVRQVTERNLQSSGLVESQNVSR